MTDTKKSPAQIFEKLMKLDEFTRKTIVLEFPQIFPEVQGQKLNTESINHFARDYQREDNNLLIIVSVVAVVGLIIHFM